ncbi:MAG: phosphotransferase [Rhodobacteraceae bacterium]|nr:phosphotransferase [Paracoccaceae bacterium]
MSTEVDAALALWGFDGAQVRFVAGRENQVFRVEHMGRVYALRIKRKGYRSHAELTSELAWMAALGRAGVRVPAPVPSQQGAMLETVAGHDVDVLRWIDGPPLGQTGVPLNLPDAAATFQDLGQTLAHVHDASDAWVQPDAFTRWAWDRDGLIGDTPVWGRFWENPTLSVEMRTLFEEVREVAGQVLPDLAGTLDYGLIHADPVRENILRTDAGLAVIDFDDGGFGFRLFDIATALLKNMDEPGYDALKQALITGYRSRRALDVTHLDLFLTLRALTYVGWIVPRLSEPGAEMRNTRFVTAAERLCRAYLDRRTG